MEFFVLRIHIDGKKSVYFGTKCEMKVPFKNIGLISYSIPE